MGTRHKHADVIHAWAEGEEIEWRELGFDRWFPVRTGASPAWSADYEYLYAVRRHGSGRGLCSSSLVSASYV